MSQTLNFGGSDLVVNSITTGATDPYTAGTAVPSVSNISTLSGNQTITGVKTYSANPVISSGNTLKVSAGTSTLSSNAATVTTYATQVTTESLSTASAASQALTITLTGVAATDLAFVSLAGGTNTTGTPVFQAVCTSNTVTVTVFNKHASAAFNGTFIFNLWVVKA